MRVQEAMPDSTLFGPTGANPEDINQGSLGNCWIMAGASAVAEVPGRIERIFLNNNNALSKTGIYGVNIYALGVPYTILIDDYLPVKEFNDNLFFGKAGKDDAEIGGHDRDVEEGHGLDEQHAHARPLKNGLGDQRKRN